MSIARITSILKSYAGTVNSSSAHIESGLAEVMVSAAENFRIEDPIPHGITTTADDQGVTVRLAVPGAWRRKLHENPRFGGYKFLERAWLKHREDIVMSVAEEVKHVNTKRRPKNIY